MLRLSRNQELFSSFCSVCNKFSQLLVNKVNMMVENKEIVVNESEKRPLESETENDAKIQKTEPTFLRIKKRNFAMMLSYLGKDYHGMQRNPGMATIEEVLIKALLKAELINSDAFEAIQNINFQRAARTDKGVSAVRQVVSLKLPENPCKDKVNEYLPDHIRVFDIKRVTKGFNSKSQCDARTYSYTIPTYAFAPENLELFNVPGEYYDFDKRKEQLLQIDGKPFHEYRIPKNDLQRLRDLLQKYKGTHNFHNFTSKVFPLDPRAKRYIMSFEAEEPIIVNNLEFITMKIKGQSFMLHQIRKMVGMAVGVMRNILTKEAFDEALSEKRYFISTAPGLGLMLNIVHYDYYNRRYGEDGLHDKLDWAEHDEEIEKFAKNTILKYVYDTEVSENPTLDWLASFGANSYRPYDESKDKEDEDKEDNSQE